MRLLICGDRDYTNRNKIKYELIKVSPLPDVIIQGGASGADTLAKQVAIELGIPVEEYPAKWNIYGKKAGPLRNLEMLEVGNPTLVLAFHDFIGTSKGTRHMIVSSLKCEIPVCLFENSDMYVFNDLSSFLGLFN